MILSLPLFSVKRSSGIFLGVALLFPLLTSAAPCDFLADWRSAESRMPTQPKTIRERAEGMRDVAQGIRSSASVLYAAYRRGEVADGELTRCLNQPEFANGAAEFRQAIPPAFFRESVAELAKVSGARTRKLAAMLAAKSTQGELVLFRLVGHFAGDESPTGEKAGFHRGERSIFMDFSDIPANDWLVIFAHEHAHSLDIEMADAMPVFADPALQTKVAELAQRTDRSVTLSTAEIGELDRWLVAGMNRGLFAEIRAWALSFEVYTEGRANGSWAPVEWMEEMLRQRHSDESAMAFAVRYLSPRFAAPTEGDGLLGRPLVRSRLAEIRKRLERGELSLKPIF